MLLVCIHTRNLMSFHLMVKTNTIFQYVNIPCITCNGSQHLNILYLENERRYGKLSVIILRLYQNNTIIGIAKNSRHKRARYSMQDNSMRNYTIVVKYIYKSNVQLMHLSGRWTSYVTVKYCTVTLSKTTGTYMHLNLKSDQLVKGHLKREIRKCSLVILVKYMLRTRDPRIV